jgi:hypothetical protein
MFSLDVYFFPNNRNMFPACLDWCSLQLLHTCSYLCFLPYSNVALYLYKLQQCSLPAKHRLNKEVDLQSFFWAVQLHSLAETPQLPPHLGSYTRALLVSQDRWHLFVTLLLLSLGYLSSVLLYRMYSYYASFPYACLLPSCQGLSFPFCKCCYSILPCSDVSFTLMLLFPSF